MINFEGRIQEIIGIMPPHSEGEGKSFPINFYPAKDMKDVNLYLSLKDLPYPLIISVLGPKDLDGPDACEVTKKGRFIVATAERDINKLNTDRWQSSYKNTLYPLADNFLDALKSSTISRLHKGLRIQEVPNYAEAKYEKDQENQIDIWDTIVIDCTVSINNNCLKPLIKNGN